MGLAVRVPAGADLAADDGAVDGERCCQWGSTMCHARGTPGFMAPELYVCPDAHGDVSVSQAVDVYSFGVLLVALFVGDLNCQWGEVLPTEPNARVKRIAALTVSGVRPVVPPTTFPAWVAPLVSK